MLLTTTKLIGNVKKVWNDNSPISSPTLSPQSIEHGVTGRGRKRVFENDASESSKSCRTNLAEE